MRLEDPLLLGGGQPRVQRQHLGVFEGAAQYLGGVADLALAGEEHQHVARRLVRQFSDGVDDRVGRVAHFGAHDVVVWVVGILVFG